MIAENKETMVQKYLNELKTLREEYKNDVFSLEKREKMKEICIRYIKDDPDGFGDICCVGRGTPRHYLLTIYSEELNESNNELKKRGLI